MYQLGSSIHEPTTHKGPQLFSGTWTLSVPQSGLSVAIRILIKRKNIVLQFQILNSCTRSKVMLWDRTAHSPRDEHQSPGVKGEPNVIIIDSEHTLLDMRGITSQGQRPGPGELWNQPHKGGPTLQKCYERDESPVSSGSEDTRRTNGQIPRRSRGTSGNVKAGGICAQHLEPQEQEGVTQRLANRCWKNGTCVWTDLPLWSPDWVRTEYPTFLSSR